MHSIEWSASVALTSAAASIDLYLYNLSARVFAMNKTSYCDETKVFSGRVVEPLYNPRISIGRILLSDTFAADHFHEVHLPKDGNYIRCLVLYLPSL